MKLTDDQRETLNARIREIFLANGFTIKEGLDDLKPYVYQAAYALLWATGYFAAQPDHSGDGGDERAAFEAALVAYFVETQPDRAYKINVEDISLWRGNRGDYAERPVIRGMWEGWQRRAALAQKAVPVAVEPVRVITCPRCRGTGYHYEWCIDKPPTPIASASEAFQSRVQPWMLACFGAEIAADKMERNHRFFEESTETVQANGMTRSEAHQLVDYVYDRPVGELHQEVGGVMVTLAALCLASGIDMHEAGEVELARVWTKIEKIRAKQAAKPKHSPLPEHTHPAAAQLSREEVLSEWQPIEAAPKTGRTVLLGYPNALGKWRTVRGQWMSEAYIAENWEEPDDAEAGWYETSAEADDVPNCWPITPTHWMPLPTAPGEKQ